LVMNGGILIFLDEGSPVYTLLLEVKVQSIMPSYVEKLLAEIETDLRDSEGASERHSGPYNNSLIEPLSERELEVLHLIAHGPWSFKSC